jgi:hypothetical protein
MKVLITILLLHIPLISLASLLTNKRINQELKQFKISSVEYMNSPATKSKTGSPFFNNSEVLTSKYVQIKSKLRATIAPSIVNRNKSGFRSNDRVESLVDTQVIERNILNMDNKSLTAAKVDLSPWSDDYWPIYRGVLGSRYSDMEFDYLSEWIESIDYIKKHEAKNIYESLDPLKIDKLSPSEKYDLLINGTDLTLTNKMWSQGRSYYNRSGSVATWMGICHGWAQASYMMQRPTKKIVVKSFDGNVDINFYPSDIKALASLLWANVKTPTRFIGGRCRKDYPQTDDNGRVLDKDCYDTNAASWHMSVVNQIGISKRSFVMDATYDYEVWNQPVIGYKYKYFNPITNEAVETIQEAIIKIKDLKEDKFKNYRSKNTKYLVGISMEVEYGVENSPIQREVETKEHDVTTRAFYLYDLELDVDKKIIGGEWYKNSHPDFLWTAPKKTRAISNGDYYILSERNWDGKSPLSQRWKDLATTAAKKRQPLAKIVESLIELSNK